MPKHHRKQSNVHNKRSSRWVTKIEKGTNGGGLNGGINIVADRETGKAYVEKVFPAEGISNGYAKREIDVMMQLRGHSSIIYIEDYFIDYHKRRGSVVMEYCTMGSLDKLISRHRNANMRPIGEHYIWKWFIQIASALQYCHYGPYPRDPREVAKWNPVFHRGEYLETVILDRL
jgi:NIMA (never in mitosis gene a)-related kinase